MMMCKNGQNSCVAMPMCVVLVCQKKDPPIRMFAALYRHYNPKPPPSSLISWCTISVVYQLLFILERCPRLILCITTFTNQKSITKLTLREVCRCLPPPLLFISEFRDGPHLIVFSYTWSPNYGSKETVK